MLDGNLSLFNPLEQTFNVDYTGERFVNPWEDRAFINLF